ncbi:MAG TPA: DinB family protein [Phycisphaerales bacterium]|nr:DinB family protein [Phycisphaerales bacterium]
MRNRTKLHACSRPGDPRMNPGDKEILADFDRTREVTIQLLKNVPPALLKKKPKGEDAAIAFLFHHISAVVDGWMVSCMQDGGPPPDWNLKSAPSKPALLRHMQASRTRLLKFFNTRNGRAMSANFTRVRDGKTYRFVGRNRVVYLTGHESHHRGKIVLALRQLGFTKIPFIPYPNVPVKK